MAMHPITIEPLPTGFLVSDVSGVSLASLTDVEDLLAFIGSRFGADGAPAPDAATAPAAPASLDDVRTALMDRLEDPAEADEPVRLLEPDTDAGVDTEHPSAAQAAPVSAMERMIADLPDNQAAVYDALDLLARAAGGREVSISLTALAGRADVKVGSIRYFLAELSRKGLIRQRQDAEGSPIFTLLAPEPADE